MTDLLNFNKKHFKRNLTSQQFNNIFTNKEALVFSCLMKILPNNYKKVFITKSCCTYLLKDVLDENYIIKFPVFFFVHQKTITSGTDNSLENLLTNKKVNSRLIFFKLFNICFLNFKEPLILISYITMIKQCFFNFKANILKTSTFSSRYA
jgi:hypothetical protein